MPKVSVVIPCYNQGAFLIEAIDSVLAQTFVDFEIVVVDDGSTDSETISILDRIDNPQIKILRTDNGGLAMARNRGILVSTGAIILPLDADDLIAPTYLEKGVSVFADDPGVGVVYSLADKFGAVSGFWQLPEFSPGLLLSENMVFCSAMFHRGSWEKVGGYNTNMKHGWEDWDFWLSLCDRGLRFVRIPEILFHYRVKASSMTASMGYCQKLHMMARLVLNHPEFYAKQVLSKFSVQSGRGVAS